ncbi:MAG: ABC transporter permease, partial [Acidobacteriota bacterium]
IQALPGVEHVATASILPFDGDHSCDGFALPDRPELDRDRPCAETRIVSPGFFETMSATVIRGRGLTEADNANAGPVAVLDQSFARKYFGTQDPVGRVISVHGQNRTIVGIAAPARLLKVSDVPVPLIYTAEEQDERAFRSRSLVLRTAKDPMSFVPAIRNIVFRLSPAAPLADVRTMREVIASSLAPQRFRAILIGGFGLAALLLATVGIAGVLGFAVSQRVREIGIRLALGSTGAGVVALVLRRALQLVLAGAAIGSAVAIVAGRFVGALLFDVSPTDPITFVAVISVLTASGVLAAAIPAMRAARVEPMTALRSE